MKHKKITINYGSHTVEKELLYQIGLVCPYCGTDSVWREVGSDDYYLGATYYCNDCFSSHHLDISNNNLDNPTIDALFEMWEDKE